MELMLEEINKYIINNIGIIDNKYFINRLLKHKCNRININDYIELLHKINNYKWIYLDLYYLVWDY